MNLSDVRDQHRLIHDKTYQELVADLKSRHPNRLSDNIELIARARFQTSMAASDVLTPPNPDYKQLMSEIDVPVLLVFGDKGLVSPAVAEKLQDLNPRLQVQQIPEAGHGLHYDQPERFEEIVRVFLNSTGNGMAGQ